ncbi:hypothetical protein GCM10009677_23430 [Sphaerisporangium rubeum]
MTFSLPSGQNLVGSWNANISGSGTMTARNAGYNGSLAPNGTTTFGFQVARGGSDSQIAGNFTCSAG